jgi:hypothetical protein
MQHPDSRHRAGHVQLPVAGAAKNGTPKVLPGHCPLQLRDSKYGYPYPIPISKGFMKTTVEISDSLLREVRRLAAREGVTLRTLVERGLHHVLFRDKASRAV